MKLNTLCTVCGSRISHDELLGCRDCKREFHAQCVEYERSFECNTCSEDRWIGAIEF